MATGDLVQYIDPATGLAGLGVGDPKDRVLNFKGTIDPAFGGGTDITVAGAAGPSISVMAGGIPKVVWILIAIAVVISLSKGRG